MLDNGHCLSILYTHNVLKLIIIIILGWSERWVIHQGHVRVHRTKHQHQTVERSWWWQWLDIFTDHQTVAANSQSTFGRWTLGIQAVHRNGGEKTHKNQKSESAVPAFYPSTFRNSDTHSKFNSTGATLHLLINLIQQIPSSESNSPWIKKFLSFSRTRRFITVLVRGHQCTTLWARWIQLVSSWLI
jgi:hypothetical protein